ncbi:hypothetical protein ABOM_002904 [Aspergillus bombycis]|uniref:Cytochrome b5 heme-binding domain-containing protein n=1 Tax=Aspergillus bombycis TaxID=109264 RepID=A0A1F8A9M3_9EURO|nr:hypothetical protein ABOM_002904 [Aspergillus bombycis]OGM48045.1 hypothetical protein ABOM_002904 [Aspergillus bombycis]
MAHTLTLKEISQHKTKDDLWLIIHNKVYDVTKFLDEHPGGEDVVLDLAGQDASSAYDDVGHSDEAGEVLSTLQIGTAGDSATTTTLSSAPGVTQTSPTSGIPSGAVYLGGLVGSLVAVGLYLNFTTQVGA